MAVVTELQAELLAALLNSGVSSETIIQALKVGERQTRPVYPKVEKLVNGTNEEQTSNYTVDGIVPTAVRDVSTPTTIADVDSSRQSIAEQLMRSDPWQSAKIIKQYMQQHNIPQREAVETTGLNQSHLSQHLNKGTPMKTQKRMTLYKWFEAKQRDVAAQYNNTSGKRPAEHDVTSPLFAGTSSYKRARRNRFKWGQASTEILYQAYESQRNPSKDEREALVEACNRAECEQRGIPMEQVTNLGPNLVTESRVYNWFANRRKEEAFKVKLAMDAGTYPVSAVGSGETGLASSPVSKLTPRASERLTMVTKSPLLPLASQPLSKVTYTLPASQADTTPRTLAPTSRLPTMSLVKCEQTPTSSHTLTPTLPYTHQIAPNAQAVLPRPISVAFGTMPPQILTPTQLQVITGIVPGQMVQSAGTGLVAQSGEITTAGALPPGHVTNLMLPGQLGAQPIPMHAVTLMSMTGGASQVLYSMPGHSTALPTVSLSTAATTSTQFSVGGQGTVTQTVNSLPTTPAVQIAAQKVAAHNLAAQNVTTQNAAAQNVAEGSTERQSQILVPQITSVKGAVSQGQPAGTGSALLTNQVYSQMILPVPAPLGSQAQALQTSMVRPTLTSKAVESRLLPGLQLPSISQLGATSAVHTPTSTVHYEKVPGPGKDSVNDGAKRLVGLEETLVVEMKPVEQVEKSLAQIGGDKPGGGLNEARNVPAVTMLPEGDEKVDGSRFREPTLTLSEEGVVALDADQGTGDDVSQSQSGIGTVQGAANVQIMAESDE